MRVHTHAHARAARLQFIVCGGRREGVIRRKPETRAAERKRIRSCSHISARSEGREEGARSGKKNRGRYTCRASDGYSASKIANCPNGTRFALSTAIKERRTL